MTNDEQRKLDARVAEGVMGFPGAHEGGWDDPRRLKDGRVLPGITPPPYSQSIEKAWEIVEAMRERGWETRINTYRLHKVEGETYRPTGETTPANRVRLVHESGIPAPVVEVDFAPIAICRAALEAVRTEEKKKS